MNAHPVIAVRARLDPDVMDRFEAWHANTHLPHLLAIPGVVRARRIRHPAAIPGSHEVEIELEDEDAIQQVMGSAEAQQARQDWNDWAAHVHELTVDVQAPVHPNLQVHAKN